MVRNTTKLFSSQFFNNLATSGLSDEDDDEICARKAVLTISAFVFSMNEKNEDQLSSYVAHLSVLEKRIVLGQKLADERNK